MTLGTCRPLPVAAVLAVVCSICLGETKDVDYPHLAIAAGGLKLTVYLPDAEKGFYRGPRFDWSGQLGQIEYQGHTFCGPFRTPHDPVNHECTRGPAEEFGMDHPPGYDEAAVGGTYIKVGVGLLRKESAAKYAFYKPNQIAQPGQWEVTHGEDWVEFVQELRCNAYACRYTKRIALEKTAAAFTIAHTLANTGTKPFGGGHTHYCHNFFILDGQPIGPDYKLAFGFDCAVAQKNGAARVETKDRQFALLDPIPPKGTLWVLLKGWAGTQEEHRMVIENAKAGAGVRITGDRPALKYVVYAERTAVCPEAFIQLDVSPGQEQTWRNRYEFFLP